MKLCNSDEFRPSSYQISPSFLVETQRFLAGHFAHPTPVSGCPVGIVRVSPPIQVSPNLPFQASLPLLWEHIFCSNKGEHLFSPQHSPQVSFSMPHPFVP